MKTRAPENCQKGFKLITLAIFGLLLLAALSAVIIPVSAESYSTAPGAPIAGDEFHINITTSGDCLAMIFITNSTGYEIWNGIVRVTENNTQLGPFKMAEGDYNVNSTFLYSSEEATNELVSFDFTFSVGPEVEEEDEYSPAYVLIVGMGVVFAVLGLLAMITFLAGKYLPKDAKPVAAATAPTGDDNEKIAAIAAIVRNRRG
jgi:Na+-transporting methylmalonyl-CoA/oxaloacetate decarboxylase gamma subunit